MSASDGSLDTTISASLSGEVGESGKSADRPLLPESAPPAALTYVREVSRHSRAASAASLVASATRLVEQHDEWRATALNLIPSDTCMSLHTRRLLGADLASRANEGYPGAKDHPTALISRYSDECEALLIALASELFDSPFVEWRAQSTSLANFLALRATTRPGDSILVQAGGPGGGNYGYRPEGLPAMLGLTAHELPSSGLFEIDLDAALKLVAEVRPTAIVVGGTKVLFPYPVAELHEVAAAIGCSIVFDGAHLGPLIASGVFPNPLRDGADVLTTGTHKMMGGPVGGLALSRRTEVAGRMAEDVFPGGLIQTRDLACLAAAVIALAEVREFGAEYAGQCVRNARALGRALEDAGVPAIGAERSYTHTHQVFAGPITPDPVAMVPLFAEAGLLVHATSLPASTASAPQIGFRLSVQEPTRRGMREPEMEQIAVLLAGAVSGHLSTERLEREVQSLMSAFTQVGFTFPALTL